MSAGSGVPLRPILIAGGGIGGLAAALALARCGFRCRVLERRAAFEEAGAGIQIGPNGVKALRILGVADALAPYCGVPDQVVVRDGRDGRVLTALPLGATIETRHGAPYWTVHRADLHAALLDAATADPRIVVTTGFEADRVEAIPDGVRLLPSSGSAVSGLALIGCDGLWSTIRGYVADRATPKFAGRRAFRAVAPATSAPTRLRANETGLWLAPAAHAVHYPVRGGAEIAVVLVLQGAAGAADWAQRVDRDVLLDGVRHLAGDLSGLFGAAAGWRSWPLFEAAPLARWSNGRVTLLGDAAHPVLPFLAQGGALALEDAVTLAAAAARTPDDLPSAFLAYATAREARTRRVAAVAKRNGAIYHLAGAAAFARNLTLRLTPAPRLIAGYDWLYGWSVPEFT